MDFPEDYNSLLNQLPLAEKYLIPKRPDDSLVMRERYDNSYDTSSGIASSPSSDEACSIEFATPPTSKVGHYGSLESGLNALGKPRSSKSYERRSEERARNCDSSPPSQTNSLPRFKGSLSERKMPRPPVIPIWKPLSTENILAKVKDLLGDQAARAKVTGIVEAQKAAKRHTESRNSPMKASHSSPVLCKHAGKSKELSLEAQVAYNLLMKNHSSLRVSDGRSSRGNSPDSYRLDELHKNPYIEDYASNLHLEDSTCNKGLGTSFGSTRSNDSVPTAHVTPNLLSSVSRNRSTTSLPSEDGLHSRHTSSTGDLRHTQSATEFEGNTSADSQRWNSHVGNSHVGNSHANDGEFQILPCDMNVTVEQSSQYNEPREAYRQRNVGFAALPTRYDVAPQHISYSQRNENQLATPREHRYGRNPPSEPLHMADRGYPYVLSSATPSYPPMYSHTYAAPYAESTTMAPHADHFDSWLQKHQELLRRQHIEVAQPAYGMTTHSSSSNYLPTQTSTMSSLLVSDPHKLDSVRLAADNIIKEKEMIIDRQKLKIMDLEQVVKDADHDKELYRRAMEDNNGLSQKLQDMWDDDTELQDFQFENKTLKTKLSQFEALNPRGSRGNLEQKLGAREHEVHELRRMLNTEMETKRDDLKKLVEKINEKDRLISDLQDKYTVMKQNHDKLQTKLESVDRYLADCPTSDEFTKQDKNIKSLQEEVALYKDQISDLEKKLSDSQKGVKSRDGLIQSLEQNVTELQAKLGKIESVNTKLKQHLNKEGLAFDDIEDLQYENKKLRSEIDSAKKLLENSHKKAQQIESRLKTDLSELRERLAQEESTVVALREEIFSKDQHLKKLRQSFKETSSTNQDLVERGMQLEDRLKEAERHVSGDAHKAEQRLIKEMSVCFTELSNLVQLCVQCAEGQDPNFSALLVVKGEADVEVEAADGLQSLKCRITKIREMRDEIDKLRQLISDKFADNLCENLNGCATQ